MTFYISIFTKIKISKISGYPSAGILGEIERRNKDSFSLPIVIRKVHKLAGFIRGANVLIIGDTSADVLKHCEDYEVHFIDPETLMITRCI